MYALFIYLFILLLNYLHFFYNIINNLIEFRTAYGTIRLDFLYNNKIEESNVPIRNVGDKSTKNYTCIHILTYKFNYVNN